MRSVGAIKLLWGVLYRMVLYGLGLGAVLGAAYGATVMALIGAFGTLTHGQAEFPLLLTVAALAMVPVGVLLSILGGLPADVFFGFALGIVNGLVLFVLTHAFYFVPRDAVGYRRVAGRTSAVASVVAFLAAWALLFDLDPGYVGFENTPGTIDGGPIDLVAFVFVPALVSGWAGRLSSRKVAGWWVHQSLGLEQHGGHTPTASERPEVEPQYRMARGAAHICLPVSG